MNPVPLEERTLVQAEHDESHRFDGFAVFRRGNEILLLNCDDPAKDVAVSFDTAAKAHDVFLKSVDRQLLATFPAARESVVNE
jgi:hypothetical protein